MMILKTDIKKNLLSSNDLVFELLESGDLFRIRYHHNQINLLRGNLLDGSVSNLYLRRHHEGVYAYKKLLGIHSNSVFEILGNDAIYQGQAFGIDYQVVLSLHGHAWVYDVLLGKKTLEGTYDLFYGQDVGIASTGSILASEAYTAQYIDHQAFKDHCGYTICSRQNQGETQVLQLGSLTKNIAYVTDGTQFFGLDYKLTNQPSAMFKKQLASLNYQYEFPYITLQSESMSLEKETSVVFYGNYVPTFERVVSKPFKVLDDYTFRKEFIRLTQPKRIKPFIGVTDVLVGMPMSEADLLMKYPIQNHAEKTKGQTLSFFKEDHTHVVTQKKELLVERPHGHMIIQGDLCHVSKHVMSSTNFMYGVFASHIVLGNTNFHKLLGVVRNFLNLDKLSGLRMYVKKGGKYMMLTMPSVYEIGINYAKWTYQLEDDTLVITTYAKKDALAQKISFKSLKNKNYDILVTQQLLMHSQEYEVNIPLEIKGDTVTIDTSKNEFIRNHYPTLRYQYTVPKAKVIVDEAIFNSHQQFGVLAFEYTSTEAFEIGIEGSFGEFKNETFDLEIEKKYFQHFIEDLTGIKLEHKVLQKRLNILSSTAFWFTHNALVHYAQPHGLEQSNGAAWGTRDICQGPVELFMASSKYDIVREILLKVFSRQFVENGDFPQWFMFDNYYKIQAHESHGDIIIWPLKTLANYIRATGDLDILDEKVPFMSMKENEFVLKDSTLKDHIKAIIKSIEDSYVPNTHLPRYGGGDWDDTLQPANHDLTSRMVSGWTVALLYDALHVLSEELKDSELVTKLTKMKTNILKDYQKYLVKDGIPAGFIVFNDKDHIDYLLHPSDAKTGLKYRLLALQRPIISEMVSTTKANDYENLIELHLKHPDGVRLMDTAVTYHGGLKTYFSRAETAANFGREIGIQYCHAHIRYIEAMAKLGEGAKAFEALFVINPIQIQATVRNARYRQSNTYFSSSDAAFSDRYEAKRDFHKVKTGEIEVKAGWRMYSSGPGIYLNQMISNVLGFKRSHNKLWLDPTVPKELDDISISYHMDDFKLQVNIHDDKDYRISLNQKMINTDVQENKYRNSGFVINLDILSKDKVNQIDIYLPLK